jgi:hypothetical protein
MNPYVLLDTHSGSIEPGFDHGSNTDMKDFREKQDFVYLSSVCIQKHEKPPEAREGRHQWTAPGAASANPHDRG